MTSDVSEVLAPCPFCGSGARFVKHSAGVRGTMAFDSWDAVACAGCGATVGACDRRFRNKDDARKAWNTRAQPAVLAVPGCVQAKTTARAPQQKEDEMSDADNKPAVVGQVERSVMQHTPGPWRFTEGEYLYVNGTDAEGKRAFIIQRTLKGQKPSVQARIRADVRLIGAAPDLLDVLIRMVEYADDGTPIHPTDNLMAEARAMVAKAVGAA